MSHNVRLSGVKFTDLTTLASVVNTVSEGKASLDTESKTFRTYAGQPDRCDATIKLSNGRWDIGLLRNADGHYEPILESALLHQQTAVGTYGAPLGKVQQEYALREAEYEAAQRGYSTERVAGEQGKIILRIAVPA